ncbi:MAG: hypothetical protein KatS3mg059_1704 [Thermomicrobiales bacterium]|nr:MAG: hypothetical protein KatS3mg059_1704 [Thermomicrobiales bacterium]
MLRGEITNWFSAGAGLSLKVEPLALAATGEIRGTPVATYDSYDALVAGLADHPGGVALVPLNAVDWRVNVLAIDGIDPAAVREIFPPTHSAPCSWQRSAPISPRSCIRAVSQALTKLGWPRGKPALTRIGIAGDLAPCERYITRGARQHRPGCERF